MKTVPVSLYRQLSFFLILVGGLIYLHFLAVFSQKIYSGFLMQFIYLFDSILLHPESFSSLLFRFDFLTQFVVGVFWSYLLILFFAGLFKVVRQLKNTRKFLHLLSIRNFSSDRIIINSPKAIVFTAGLFRPQLYISQKIIDISTPGELSSIINHEQSHRVNRDPFRNILVDFISYVIPYFPGKSWFFGQYYTLVEISCDTYSQKVTSHPKSLISALVKVQESFSPLSFSLSHFSTQSERIKILVGQKKLSPHFILTSNVLMIAIFFFSASLLYRTDFIYECQHLVKCFQNLVIPDHILSPPIRNGQSCDFPTLSS